MEQYQAQRLVDARAAAYNEAKDLLVSAAAENRELTAEETETHKRALDKVDALTGQLEQYEQQVRLDAKFAEIEARSVEDLARKGVGTTLEPEQRSTYETAFDTYITRGTESLTAEQRSALDQRATELRAMGVITGPGGGYTAPEGWWAKVTETMLFYGGMLSVGCEQITTTTGNPLTWPTNNDTANTGSWVSENVDNGTATDLDFGQKTLYAHGLSSGVLKVSKQYLEDTDPQTSEPFLARKLGERLGRTLNTALTTGNGIGRPAGIINGLSTGKTTGSSTVITYAELIDLEHSVDVAYRNMPGVGYMFHDLILGYLRKIVDANTMPIFQVSYRVGEPNTINGRPFTINNDMASTLATTNKTVAFGDFRSSYVIRTVSGGGQIQRLVERYAELQQVGFISFARYDGLVQDTSAVKLLVQV